MLLSSTRTRTQPIAVPGRGRVTAARRPTPGIEHRGLRWPILRITGARLIRWLSARSPCSAVPRDRRPGTRGRTPAGLFVWPLRRPWRPVHHHHRGRGVAPTPRPHRVRPEGSQPIRLRRVEAMSERPMPDVLPQGMSIVSGWLCEEADGCTCGTPDSGAYGHEPGCGRSLVGLEPIESARCPQCDRGIKVPATEFGECSASCGWPS